MGVPDRSHKGLHENLNDLGCFTETSYKGTYDVDCYMNKISQPPVYMIL